MSLATDPLPANPSALRIFAADLQAELARKDIEIAANAAEIHAKTLHIEKLKMQLAVLRRARFGRSSEKLNRDIEQLELLIGTLEQDAAAEEARINTAEPDAKTDSKPPAKTHQRNQPIRAPLPAHLPRETVTHEPACACPGCGGTTFSRIGQDEREVLEYIPSSFKGDPACAAEAELPVVRDDRTGADAVAADRARAAWSRPDRACAGLEIL